MRRHTAYAYVLAAGTVLCLIALLPLHDPPDVGEFLFWIVFLGAAELLPLSLPFSSQLTMSFPIHLALAFLYEPGAAMMIAGIAAFDQRELRRELPLWRVVFNRAQIMVAVGAAAALYSTVRTPDLVSLWVAPTALALVLTNLALVAVMVSLHNEVALAETLRDLVPRPVGSFLIFIGLLTALGVSSAFIYENVTYGEAILLLLYVPLMLTRVATIAAAQKVELSELVQKQQQALLQATEKIFEEREDERNRIAETIHDSSLQSLAAASYGCGNALAFMNHREYEPAERALATAQEALNMAMTQLRDSLKDLRSSSLEAGGLLETLTKKAEDVKTLWGSEVRIESSVVSEPPLSVSLVACQILQEAMVNAAKHGSASIVEVGIDETDAALHVVVEDDGVGFDATQEIGQEHHGMRLMRERAEQLGGRLVVTSIIGRGTRIEATLPAGVAQ